MAMLMMPERSPTRPHMAPKISGTDRARAPASRVVIGITPPDPPPAQARKETTNSTPQSIGDQEPRLIRLTAAQIGRASRSDQEERCADQHTRTLQKSRTGNR